MKKNIIVVITLLASISLTGCAKNFVQGYSELDKSDKSITVPPGGELNGALKVAFKKDGWDLKINSNTIVTEGIGGQQYSEKTTIKSDTRYKLLTSSTRDHCFTCNCVSHYNISIIDNESGEEVVTFDGHERKQCYEDVTKRVMDWIHKKNLSSSANKKY